MSQVVGLPKGASVTLDRSTDLFIIFDFETLKLYFSTD